MSADPAHQRLTADYNMLLLHDKPWPNSKTSVRKSEKYTLLGTIISILRSFPASYLSFLPQDASFAKVTQFTRGANGHPRGQKENSKGMSEVQTQEMQSEYLSNITY